jgi:hypothetical protein
MKAPFIQPTNLLLFALVMSNGPARPGPTLQFYTSPGSRQEK